MATSETPLIACIGDACVDLIVKDVQKFPKWGHAEPINSIASFPGGQAINCAIALQKMGGVFPVPIVRIGCGNNRVVPE